MGSGRRRAYEGIDICRNALKKVSIRTSRISFEVETYLLRTAADTTPNPTQRFGVALADGLRRRQTCARRIGIARMLGG